MLGATLGLTTQMHTMRGLHIEKAAILEIAMEHTLAIYTHGLRSGFINKLKALNCNCTRL